MNLFDKVKPVFNIDDEMNELLAYIDSKLNEIKITDKQKRLDNSSLFCYNYYSRGVQNMENENNNVINEEQIKEEAKIEFEKEAEIKEQVRQEVQEEIRQEEIKKQESKSRKKGVFRFIYNTIITLLILFVVFETVMGLLDMQRLNDDKEPIWYIDSKVEETDNGKETTYNLGLYVIEKTESSAEKKVVLKPFFMKNKK